MQTSAFRERWPSIAQIPCVGDLLDSHDRLERKSFERVTALRLALRDLLDAIGDAPCRYDHEGYCQEHFVSSPCEVATARHILEVG